jgi:hypothetical protein
LRGTHTPCSTICVGQTLHTHIRGRANLRRTIAVAHTIAANAGRFITDLARTMGVVGTRHTGLITLTAVRASGALRVVEALNTKISRHITDLSSQAIGVCGTAYAEPTATDSDSTISSGFAFDAFLGLAELVGRAIRVVKASYA